MSFPESVDAVTLTCGPVLDADGNPRADVKLYAVPPPHVFIAETKLRPGILSAATGADGTASLEVIATDSAGLADIRGNTITSFRYRIGIENISTASAEREVSLPKAVTTVAYEDLVTNNATTGTLAGLTSTFAPRVGGAETLVAKDDLRHPALVVAAAGDSTGDEPTEWLWRGLTMWAAQRTDLTAEGYYGYGESGPYTGPTSIQASSDGYWSTYFNDTFSRVGDVYGSTPDSGTTYGGALGGWTADGSAAVATGTGNSAVQETTAGGAGGKRKASLSVVLDTTPGANDKVISLFLGQNTSNRVQLRLSVSTGGTQAWIINKIVGGSSTTIATGSGSPLTANAINQFDMSIEMDGTTGVTARVGASSVSGTLAGGDVAAVVDAAYRIYFQTTNSASAGTKVDRAWAEKWVTAAARTLTFYNGSRAGSIASYAIDRLANLYPVAPDVLFVSYGINYGSGGTVAAFETALDALCLAFRTAHPTAGIVICSQNPLFDPVSSGSITAHQARNAALRRYAAKNGYGYLPVGEMYAAQADGGASWIQSDGAHPKTASDDADPNNGAYQAAILLRDYLNGLSLRD